MTALLVLRPGLSDTANRAVARTGGTLAGPCWPASLWPISTPGPAVLAVVALFCAWLAYSLNNVNYALFTLCLTAYIVFLLGIANLPGSAVAYHRAVSTIIGGSLALTVRLIVIRYRKRHANPHPVPHLGRVFPLRQRENPDLSLAFIGDVPHPALLHFALPAIPNRSRIEPAHGRGHRIAYLPQFGRPSNF